MAFSGKQIVQIYGVCVGVNTITTLSIVEDAVTLAEKQALAIEIRDQWMPSFKTGCAAAMNWIAIVVAKRGDPDYSPYSLPVNIVGGGSSVGPPQVAIQWKLESGQQGKSGRGRLYVPGITNSTFAAGVLSSTTQTSLNTVMTAFNARYTVGGSGAWHLGVFSRKDDTLYPVTQITYSIIPSTLRSRRLGTGI